MRTADKTKESIWNALCTLLKTKSIDRITIEELTKKAGISRNTYYYHFYKIEDVIEYKSEQFFKGFAERTMRISSNDSSLNINNMTILESETDRWQYIYDNKDLIQVVYAIGMGRSFMIRFIKEIQQILDTAEYTIQYADNCETLVKDEFFLYYTNSIAFRYYSFLECWMSRDFCDSPGAIAGHLIKSESVSRIIYNKVRTFEIATV